ncbi:hypothetical protein [Streptomyces tricolor]
MQGSSPRISVRRRPVLHDGPQRPEAPGAALQLGGLEEEPALVVRRQESRCLRGGDDPAGLRGGIPASIRPSLRIRSSHSTRSARPRGIR